MHIGPGLVMRQSGGFSPARLFATGQDGVWYDPRNFGALYQDSSGITPVTAGTQPVGLLLDMRKGLARGGDLGITEGFPVTKVVGPGFSVSNTPVVNLWYELTYSITASDYTGALYFEPAVGPFDYEVVLKTVGTHRRIARAVDAQTRILDLGDIDPTGSITFSGITCKALAGNHAVQATAADRATLNASPTALTFDGVSDSLAATTGGAGTTGFFWCTGVGVVGGAATARTLWSDTGSNTGYRVRINATNKFELAAGNATAYTTIASAADAAVDSTYVLTAWDDGTNLNVQINQGAVASVARPAVSAGTAAFTVGKDNGAATSFFNGRLFDQVYRKNGGVSAADRAATQRFIAARAGVTL